MRGTGLKKNDKTHEANQENVVKVQDKQVGQKNRTESRNRITLSWSTDFQQRFQSNAIEKGKFSMNGAGTNGEPYGKKRNFNPQLTPYTKIIQGGSQT